MQRSSYEPQLQQKAPEPAPARPVGPPKGFKRPGSGHRDLSRAEVGHVDVDESVVERSIFSPSVLAMLGGMLVLGLVFGSFGAKASQARSVYDIQTSAATNVREDITPFIEEANKTASLAAKLDPTKPQYDVVEQLTKAKFVPDAGILGGSAAYIGGGNVYNITQFIAKAATFKQLLDRHNYVTKIDKAELTELLEGNELLQGDKNFAVIFNHKRLLEHLKNKGEDKDFKPSRGSLVLVDKFEVTDEGDVTYESLQDKSKNAVNVRNVVPIDKAEILKTGGQNALQRYKRRVEVISFYAADLKKSTNGLLEGLSKVADRGSAPLLQLSVPDAPEAAQAPAE